MVYFLMNSWQVLLSIKKGMFTSQFSTFLTLYLEGKPVHEFKKICSEDPTLRKKSIYKPLFWKVQDYIFHF